MRSILEEVLSFSARTHKDFRDLLQAHLDAGYNVYPASLSNAAYMLQKIVWNTDKSKKLYFIDVFVYDFSKFDQMNMLEYQFTIYDSKDRRVRIAVDQSDWKSHTDVEKLAKKMYHVLDGVPNIHNN